MREASFMDYSIWKPIRTQENQRNLHHWYVQQHQLQDPGQEIIKKRLNSLHNILLIYLLHIMMKEANK
jgi:hypothetical protein